MINIQAARTRIDKRTALIAALLVGLLGTGLSSLALLTDQLDQNMTAAAATVDLQASLDGTTYNGVGQGGSYTLDFGAVFVGNSTNKAVTLKNGGSAELRYAGFVVAAGQTANAANYNLAVYSVANEASCPTTGTPTGTSIASGTFAATFFGQPTTGPDTGDRTLAAGASEILCFSAALPAGSTETGNVAATFRYMAEDTATTTP